MKTIAVQIDDQSIHYQVEGESQCGGDEILLQQDDNLLQHTAFSQRGYSVESFLTDTIYQQLVSGLQEVIYQAVNAIEPINHSDFSAEKLHEVLDSEDKYSRFALSIREGYAVEQLPIDVKLIEARVSEICKIPVHAVCPTFGIDHFYLRTVRPGAINDNNPPHRDVWLKHLRNCVNIYLPVAGSTHLSSLPILPGSHLWFESEIERATAGAVNGMNYRVSAITATKQPFKMTRPNPGANQFLIFSPYLIHGGGVNFNPDKTRASLEMRFWRKGEKNNSIPIS